MSSSRKAWGKRFLVTKKLKRWKKNKTPRLVKPILKEYKPVPQFPPRLKSTKRGRENEEIINTFCEGRDKYSFTRYY